MPTNLSHPYDAEPKGLPPVTPPSGRHILQLFLVPGIIVAAFVVAYVGIRKFTQSWYTPEAFLGKLDNADPDVRWRAADDLAQVLLRNDELASNPGFALDLTERLRLALDANGPNERAYAEHGAKQSPAELAPEKKNLDAERNYITFLTACIGNFAVPVPVPLLSEMAVRKEGADPVALGRWRRRAVMALATLGANARRFDKLPSEKKSAILEALGQEKGDQERRRWASAAAELLRGRIDGHPEAPGMDTTLAECARDRDPFVREMAAVALNYWEGTPAENARMETTLVGLYRYEDGHGADDPVLRPLFRDEDDPAKEDRQIDDPGQWRALIRSQAAVALIRRGSSKIRLAEVGDLLDEQKQLQTFRKKLPDGQEVADEARAYATVGNALRAVEELHARWPERDLSALYPAISRLTDSPNATLKTEARHAQVALGIP